MKTLFILGDSISIHYGPYLKEFVSGKMVVQRKGGMGRAVGNLDAAEGANGGDSGMVLSYLKRKIRPGTWKPDCLVQST